MSDDQKNGTAFERLIRGRKLQPLELPAYFQAEGEALPSLSFYPLSSADMREIYKVAKDDAFLERVETLRKCVLDQNGERFFQIRDRDRMLNDVPYVVVSFLYDQIVQQTQSVAALLGKSEATTS